MVKKKTIGKIQLVIGIIILIAGIIGIYCAIYDIGGFLPTHRYIEGLNETQAIKQMITTNQDISIGANALFVLLSTSVIITLLSLIFITQGLLNISGEKTYG